MRKHLRPDGRLVISIFNPSLEILNRDPSDRFLVEKIMDTRSGDEITIEESTSYDSQRQLATTTWYHSKLSQKDFYTHKFVLRVLFPEELNEMLNRNGFEIEKVWGNYQRKIFEMNDRFQIVLAKQK